MLPYTKHSVTAQDEACVLAALRCEAITQGPMVPAFEGALAERCGAKHAVAVNSGTAALHLAMRATGVTANTVVWATPISFVATANAALLCGAQLAFGEVDTRGLVQGWIGPATHFVPVTLGGIPRPLSPRERQKTVILDACHGPLTLPDGVAAACFSFHPAKHVACGEGGAVVTDDADLALRVRVLRDHGRTSGSMVELSLNYRMPDLNAALGISQLERYEEGVTIRRQIAARYDAALKAHVGLIQHPDDSARHLYQITVDNRDAFREHLRENGVGSQVHYKPIHLEPFYRRVLGSAPGHLPLAESFAARTLSLPLYPTLTEEEQETVINAVIEAAAEAKLDV